MNVFQLWITGYYNPKKMISELSSLNSPFVGLYSILIRGFLISIFTYLPQYFMNKIPVPPSYFTFISGDKYFLFLTYLSPIYFLLIWLLSVSLQYIYLQLFEKKIDINVLFNLTGLISLIVGIVLILWDWIWIFFGIKDVYFLGISHLIIDIWAISLSVYGLKKLLAIPVLHGIIINVIGFACSLPLAILIMRAPL